MGSVVKPETGRGSTEIAADDPPSDVPQSGAAVSVTLGCEDVRRLFGLMSQGLACK